MRILFLTHGFNSLAQRLFIELRARGHEVSVEFDINDAVSLRAVALFKPDLIIAPFLKRAIPESIWREHICHIVHPGPPGDRGPSSLDWAIANGATEWGVTVLQAEKEMDAGPVWASAKFPMRAASKSSLYRNEVTTAAVEAILAAVELFLSTGKRPPRNRPITATNRGWRPAMKQADRAIDWERDDTATVLRKIRAGDGMPGVKDRVFDRELFLYDAHAAGSLGGRSGEILARSGPAICRATTDGAVWIGHLREPHGAHPFKLPATRVLAEEVGCLPEIPTDSETGYREIRYEESNGVGYLHFAFYNGAMGTDQCERLLAKYEDALRRDTCVLVLMGGPDFWSNGMNLNVIEAADSPAEESWCNINAIDDLTEIILRTQSHLTIAALQGNAGAGGVFLARACDRVWLRSGVVLNPHYKDMGNLFGSEFWTYSLPRHAGKTNAERLTQARLPMGGEEALALGLADTCFAGSIAGFNRWVEAQAEVLADSGEIEGMLAAKQEQRGRDESDRPLAEYRAEELERMRLNFFGFDPSYHIARYNFVHKVPKSRTPVTIARHRDMRDQWRNVS